MLTIWDLIKKSNKLKDSFWLTSHCILRIHGKRRNINFCIKTYKLKFNTKINIWIHLFKTWLMQLMQNLSLIKRLKKKLHSLKIKHWEITKLRDGKLINSKNTFLLIRSLWNLSKFLETLELSSLNSWFRTFCISKERQNHKLMSKVISFFNVGKASIDWKNVKRTLINKDLFSNVLAYVIEEPKGGEYPLYSKINSIIEKCKKIN